MGNPGTALPTAEQVAFDKPTARADDGQDPRLSLATRRWELGRESELIRLTLQGDAEAFGELVRAHQDRLYTSLVHFLGNEADAQDVAQDAFVQALQQLPRFQQQSAFYTWLYRIAFNLASNRVRRRQREREVLADRPHGGSTDESASQQLERREAIDRVREALAGLPEPYRSVIVLREIDGADYAAIAQILEIEVGTVRSRLHRARQMLRETLLQELSDDR